MDEEIISYRSNDRRCWTISDPLLVGSFMRMPEHNIDFLSNSAKISFILQGALLEKQRRQLLEQD